MADRSAVCGIESVERGDIHPRRVEIHFPVGRHVVQERRLQHPFEAVATQVAKHPVLLLPVFQKHVVRRQVGGVEVVEQQLPVRVDLGHLHFITLDAPLPDEAHGADLPARLPEHDDIFALAAEESLHRHAVVADEA